MSIPELNKFREKYPQYNNLSDYDLASRLGEKYPEAYGNLFQKVQDNEIANAINQTDSGIPGLFGNFVTPKTSNIVSQLLGFKPSEPKTVSAEDLQKFTEQTGARLNKIKALQRQMREYSEEEQKFIGAQVASDVGNLATKPLREAGSLLNQGISEVGKAFIPTGNVNQGLSNLSGGVAKIGQAPFAATLGYLNEAINPISEAIGKTDIGKKINESQAGQIINQLLTKPATTVMQGVQDVTGLQKPSSGALELGDFVSQLLLLKAAESALPKSLKAPEPYRPEVPVSKARLEQLKTEQTKNQQVGQTINLPSDAARTQEILQNEGKNTTTGTVSTKQGESVKPTTEAQTTSGTAQRTGPGQEGTASSKIAQTNKGNVSKPELKKLQFNTKKDLLEGTLLNSPKLKEYANDNLPTLQVYKRLKEYGLFDEVKKIQDSLPIQAKHDVVKGAEFETIARILLKKADELANEKAGQKPSEIQTPITSETLQTPETGIPKTTEKPVESETPKTVAENITVAETAKTMDQYKAFRKDLKDKKFTTEELVDEIMQLDQARNKQKPNGYELKQIIDLTKKLGDQTKKDVIVDAKNIWVDGKKVTGKESLSDLVKPAEKPAPVKLTPEAAARKAAAEKIAEPKPKVEKPAEPAKPKNFYEALRETENYTVKDLAAATKQHPKKIANMIQDLAANKMVRKTTDPKGKVSFKPTEEFKVLLDDMIKKPKQYKTDLGTLYSNPIPAILKGLGKAQTFLDDAFAKTIGKPLYDKLGKGLSKIVPEKLKEQIIVNYGLPKEYTVLRQYAKDAISRYNELAKEIGDALLYKDKKADVEFSKAEQKRLAQIIKGSVTKDPLMKKRADTAIKEIKQLETLGKQLEVLPFETYNTKLPRIRINELLNQKRKLEATAEKIKDIDPARAKQLEAQIKNLDTKVKNSFKHGGEGYFKRVFLSKEQQKVFSKYGYSRPTRLDLTSALHRKDIPVEVRKQMGEILEASYPTAKGIVLEGKDVSLGNFFKAVSERPDWVSTVERPGFTKMPKDRKLGKLSDMWVEERIAADINDIVKLTSPEHFDAFLRKINSIWKATKTIMNPSTHMRNVMSNSIMLDFSGVPHSEQARILPEAIKAIKGTGKYAREFKASRLDATTFAKAELGQFLDVVSEAGSLGNFGKMTAAEKATKLYGKLSLVDTKLGDFMGKIYQAEETLAKAIKFIAEREKGKSILEARTEANKWLFDYGEIPKAVEFLRNNPLIGKPFVTWSYKAFPRILEAAITRPVSFWKYPVIFSVLTKYAIDKLGITQEEWDKIKAEMPDRMAKGEWLLLPMRDENGKMQMLDLTYILPYKDVYDINMQAYTLATTGQMQEGKNIAESVVNMIDSPVTTMISELQSNKNTYTGLPIYSEVDTPGEQMADVLDYLYKLYMPSLAPEIPGISEGGYSYHKLASTIAGKEDYYGRNFTLGPAILSAFAGIKTTPIDPAQNRQRKYWKLRQRLIEFSKKKSRIKKDPTIEIKDKREQIKEIDVEISKIKAELQKLGVKRKKY